eukprot:7386746-Prymnesium_polylepis.1
MSLGHAEDHRVLPLVPGASTPPVRLGDHELRVLQCIGHYARAGARPGDLVSDYPLLLLHVCVSLRLVPPDADGAAEGGTAAASRLEEARRLGSELERLLG